MIKNSIAFKNKLILFGVALLSRMVFISFAQSVDADATSRLFSAYNWIETPTIIYEGVWLPFHYYFVAFSIFIFNNNSVGELFINILTASLIVFPLYSFTEREYSKKGAFLTVLLFIFLPVFFRNSFLTLSGIPNALFIAFTLNYISLSIRENSVKYAVLAGLSITIASGFRYESWLLFALLTGIFLLSKKLKLTFVFWSFGMVFPLFWMIGNYIAHGDIFYGLSGAYHWNIELSGVNDYLDFTIKFTRGIFFPFSIFLQITPLIFIGLVILFWKKKMKFTKPQLIWLIPFIVFLAIFIYKGINGTLFLQHRFTILLFLLFVPALSIPFGGIENKKRFFLATLFVPITLLISSVYIMKIPFDRVFAFSYTLNTSLKDIRISSINQFPFLPRLSDQEVVNQLDVILQNVDSSSGLILDFDSWESTFFLARSSKLNSKQIFIADGVKHGKVEQESIVRLLENTKQGIIMLKCYSKLSDLVEISENQFHLKSFPSQKVFIKELYRKNGITIFSYKKSSFELNGIKI